jgi:hypothetical protein
MHLTGHELTLIPSAVAALAIVGGYLGVRSANHNARLMAKGQYQQENRTKTYISMLKGVHYRGLRSTLLGDLGPGRHVPRNGQGDLSSDEEALFSAQLFAYASPEIYIRWVDFDNHSKELETQLIKYRANAGPLTSIRDFPELVSAATAWRQAREQLVNLIRADLGAGRRRSWHPRDWRRVPAEFKFPDWADKNG